MLTELNPPAEHAQGALDSIELEEQAFNMGRWCSNVPEEGLLPNVRPSSCGTTLCAAGFVAHNAGWRIIPGGDAEKDGVSRHVEDVARDLLGPNTDWIFYTNAETAKNALRMIAEGFVPSYETCGVPDSEDDDIDDA